MWELAETQAENICEFGFQKWQINHCGLSAMAKHTSEVLPSRLLAVLRVCRVCSHHCMKVSWWLLLTPWNNFSSFSSSSTFLLARPLNELLFFNYIQAGGGQKQVIKLCITHITCMERHESQRSRHYSVYAFLNKYLRLALPLLVFCVLRFRDWGACWTASFTASSQKPMLELWVSPQILLESEPQLVRALVFTDPHAELLRVVCE